MKTVLITGCSSGFGQALVSAYLSKGWNVIATMRHSQKRANLFANETSRFQNQLFICDLDVTAREDRLEIVDLVNTRYGGKLDLLVNNAGYGLFGALEDLSEQQIKAQMDVNFLGLTYITKSLLPALRAARGRIINLSSFFGLIAAPQNSLYCASKFAVEGLSEALYHELKPFGIQVAIVEPGATKTQFGTNVIWGESSLDTKSQYSFQTSNYKAIKERVSAKASDSKVVVDTIIKISHAKKMPLRNVTGSDARSMMRIKGLVPQRMFLGMLSLVFSKTFSKRTFNPS